MFKASKWFFGGLIALSVASNTSYAQSEVNNTVSELSTPKLGSIGNSDGLEGRFCPDMATWNHVLDFIVQEREDSENFQKFKVSDPRKAFSYWNAIMKDSEQIQNANRELCSVISNGTEVLVLGTATDILNEQVFLVQTSHGQGIVGTNFVLLDEVPQH